MLLQLRDSLEELIVELLGRQPNLPAQEIRRRLQAPQRQYTIRAVYKELAKLEKEGVVVKVKDRYSLRMVWVISLSSFVDTVHNTYLTPSFISSLILAGQEKQTWRFTNLTKMDMVWTQLMLGLHRAYPGKAMCIWCPHQWFDLAHGRKQQQFMRANELAAHKRFHIIGADTYLDRLCVPHLPKSERFSFAKSRFDKEQSTYYTVIGEHVISVKLDKRTADEMDKLFNRVASARQAGACGVTEFFSKPVKVRLTLERSKTKASRIKRKFADFFGVRLAEIG